MNNNFKENLRKIRKENNLSQEQLADELGVSRQAISKWESGVAYPEMDKIIALCDKFNLNIDDLLHKDIKEVKGEEESKNKLNNYINDFLKFITDTINLFSSMNFKSKLKCLFEQAIIAFVLLALSLFITSILDTVFNSILSFLPYNIQTFITGILHAIIILALVIISIIIITHVFKTRYLNYYKKLKNESSVEKEEKEDNKIELKKEEEKIIIRDTKHSEYNFINITLKFIVLIIKLFAVWFGICLAFILVGLLVSLIASFLMYKTGLFFIGLLITIISSSVIAIILILLILNFVFNRKNDKKKMIWSFIIALITFGIGCGLIFTGSLSFDVSHDDKEITKQITKEYEMRDDLLIYQNNYYEIEYIETEDKNVKITYEINKYCDVIDEMYGENNNVITVWTECENPINIAREYIKNINDKKIIPMSSNIEKMTIYTNKTNIEKLKNNWNTYLLETKEAEQNHSSENEVTELENENRELKREIEELKRQIED